VLDADEPELLAGNDSAPNPLEFILHAMAACLTITIVYHAAVRGIAIEAVESQLEGDIDVRMTPAPMTTISARARRSFLNMMHFLFFRCAVADAIVGATFAEVDKNFLRERPQFRLPPTGNHVAEIGIIMVAV
jgi:organic hydroperoxide reductase OsmC/OhrA